MRTGTRVPGGVVLFLAVLVAAGGAALAIGAKGPNERKIVVNCSVGDGTVWAGGFVCGYAIGTEAKRYKVSPLDPKDVRVNTFSRPLTVEVGQVVSVSCVADWAGKPVSVWIVGGGHTAKKNNAVSPGIALQTRTIS